MAISANPLRATGILIETQRDAVPPVEVWLAAPGAGTPLVTGFTGGHLWAYWATCHPQAHDSTALTGPWLSRLERAPQTARALPGVFALIVVNRASGNVMVVGDRLGVQVIYYVQTSAGAWVLATHLQWLLLKTGHEGAVDPDGWLEHVGFGYTSAGDHQVYRGVQRLPPAVYAIISGDRLDVGTYWSPPEPTDDLDKDAIPALASYLRDAIHSGIDDPPLFLGLTAGKDSLCLSSTLSRAEPLLTGTYGTPDCADQLQAPQIAHAQGWRHVVGHVCPPSEFARTAATIAFHSAGLNTASYVDLIAFLVAHIPPNNVFVVGEGGECVRDFFRSEDGDPIGKLVERYTTPLTALRGSLAADYLGALADYPHNILHAAKARAPQPDDETFAVYFYRFQRMYGNFALRHQVVSTQRAKTSPFLDSRFIDGSYRANVRYYVGSGLHRGIIAHCQPALLPYFDAPLTSARESQDWSQRFQGETGTIIRDLLVESLPLCDDVLDPVGTLRLLDQQMTRPSRDLYYLLRILSFSLARTTLRTAAPVSRAQIEQDTVVVDAASNAQADVP
jgi:hypothetical protein